MATNKPFPTFAMFRFINAISIVQDLHQQSFGCPNILALFVDQFLKNPVGNLPLYASITVLVGSNLTTTDNPANLAHKWFYLNSMHREGFLVDSPSNDLTALFVHNYWFWHHFLIFEEYDNGKYYGHFILTVRWLLQHITCGIHTDLLKKVILVDPVCFFFLKWTPHHCQTEEEDAFHVISLAALSGSLERIKEGLCLHSIISSDSRPLCTYVDQFRRKLETALETGAIFRTALCSGFIRDSVLNQGEATSAGHAELIGLFTGVPTGSKLFPMRKACYNLRRLYYLYADHSADAPKKPIPLRFIRGERHGHVAREAAELWTLLGLDEERSTTTLVRSNNHSSPNRPSDPNELARNHSTPHCCRIFAKNPRTATTSSFAEYRWLFAACGIHLSMVIWLCWSCISYTHGRSK